VKKNYSERCWDEYSEVKQVPTCYTVPTVFLREHMDLAPSGFLRESCCHETKITSDCPAKLT